MLRETKRSLNESLVIRVDGSDPKLLADFAAIIDHQLAPPTLPAPANPRYDYFRQTRGVVRVLHQLREGIDRELEHHEDVAGGVKKIAKGIYRLRPFLSKIPTAGPAIDKLVTGLEVLGAEEHLEAAHVKADLETLASLKTLKGARGFFFYKRLKETLRHNPHALWPVPIAVTYTQPFRIIVDRTLPSSLLGKSRPSIVCF
ncbi:MAG: hypothetical protein ABI871_06185 [Chthoniobacterales bacterium]